MSKLTVAELADFVEALRIQAATTAIDMADEIATLRAEIVSLKAMLATRPSQVHRRRSPGRGRTWLSESPSSRHGAHSCSTPSASSEPLPRQAGEDMHAFV